MTASPTQQAEGYREYTQDAGGHDDIETEAEFNVELGDVHGWLGLVEFRQLSCDQVTQAIDRHTDTHCKQQQWSEAIIN